ncbi:MAG: putative glucose-6-phosphate 1-epimerase [Pseudomonadota bacterium]|jgi:glucose-6-phosphate 1-epimerase
MSTEATFEDYAGLPCRRLTLPCGDSVLVALHGAHVLSWAVRGIEQLYLSPLAVLDGRAAIRGGVPICFPQFNQRGSLPKHGFARNMPWTAGASTINGEVAKLTLHLACDDATRALWPVDFDACLVVDLSPAALQITLAFTNKSPSPVAITGALHTYLAVDDIANAQVGGLEGQAEWNALTDVRTAAPATLTFDSEFDRVYSAAPQSLTLNGGTRQVAISQSDTWADTVVWNPGAPLCAKMADMPADGYAHMLCIEAAQVIEPVTVAPGAVWQGWQRLVSTIGAC